MNSGARTQGLIAINIAAVIFGSAALYGKLNVSPFWIVSMRAVFAAGALFLLGFLRSQLSWPSSRQIPILLLTGVILSIHWLTFFASVQLGGIAMATLTFAAFPLFTVIIDVIRSKRKPRVLEIFSALAIIGAVKLLVEFDFEGSNESLGALAGLISALAFAWFGLASQNLAKSISPLLVSLYQNTAVAVLLLPFLPFVGRAPSGPIDWICLALLGVVTTALMHQLYFYALRRLSATACSSFVALEPVYAIIFANLFFKEPITLMVAISAALILAASFLLLQLESEGC